MRRQSDRLTIIERHWLWQDSLYMQKRDPNFIDCNFGKDSRILMIFGTSISKATGHQMAIQFPTSPNICFYNTCMGKTEQTKYALKWTTNVNKLEIRSHKNLITVGSEGALWAPPAGSGAEPHAAEIESGAFSLKIWHLVATILIIFLRINWSNLVQYCSVNILRR